MILLYCTNKHERVSYIEIDKFIQFLGTVKDKDVKRLVKKAVQKGRNKVTALVRKNARRKAKSKNNFKGKYKSYLTTYKGGKIVVGDGSVWARSYNKNGKANFLEKHTFSKWRKHGLNAFEKSEKEADKIFKQEVNKIVSELIRRF